MIRFLDTALEKQDGRSPMSDFDILEEIANVETIAAGNRIRELPRLEKQYGSGRWRKMKGVRTIQRFSTFFPPAII